MTPDGPAGGTNPPGAAAETSGVIDRDSSSAERVLPTSLPTRASPTALRALDWLNFLLADVQTGVGPFLAIYLAGYAWDEERVGLALSVGGIAGIVAQTPAGALVDFLRAKRALLAAAVVALATGALLIALWPAFWPIMGAQVLIGSASSVFIPVLCAISLGIVGRVAFDERQGRNQTFNAAGNVVAAADYVKTLLESEAGEVAINPGMR